MRTTHWILLVLTCLLCARPACAELVVVVSPQVSIDHMSREEVVNIFLGRFRQIGGGVSAMPVDLPPLRPEKTLFYQKLLNKNLAEINAYRARLVFSGRTQPLRQALNDEDMLSFVATTQGAIGYIERAKADARVKIVYVLSP
jgi:hypothetical protein